MKYLVVVAFLSSVCLAHAKPSILGSLSLVGPAAPGVLLQGPSSVTNLIGPDGSVITASAIGGTVAAAPKLGGVVTAAVAPGIVAAPVLASRAVLAGPSGTVISPSWGAPIIAGPAKGWGGIWV